MRRFFLILLLFAFASCASGPKGQSSALLRTVPSRSIELMSFKHAGKGLELLLDSTHVFRQLSLGRLESHEMLLSYDYSSTLVPLLAIDAGRARKDTSEAVKQLLSQAGGLKLNMALTVDTLGNSSAVLISPSTASIAEALIHINAGASILDAPGFNALDCSQGGSGWAVLRHSAASRWLPSSFMKGLAPRRQMVKFISDLCEWSIINFSDYNTRQLKLTSVGLERGKYLSIFQKLKGGKCELGSILPDSTNFFVDLPLSDAAAFYDERSAWLDAKSTLHKHKRESDALFKKNGVRPQEWLSHIKEAAIIQWNGRSVLAIRTQKPLVPRKKLASNPIQGIPALLFGELFSLPDESNCRANGKWLIIGATADIDAFLSTTKNRSFEDLPRKRLKYAVYESGTLLSSTDNLSEINVYL